MQDKLGTKNEKIIKNCLLTGVFFLPFIKVVPFLALIVALFYYIPREGKEKNYFFNKLDYSIVIFFFITVVTSLFNFFQPLVHGEKIFTGILLGLVTISYYFIARNCFNKEEDIKKFIWVLSLQALILAIYGIWQYYGLNYARVHSFVGENILPNYFNFALPFLFILAFHEKRYQQKIYLTLVMVLSTICLTLTFSRGGWLGFLAMLLFTWLLLINKKIIPWLGGGLITAFFLMPPSVKERFLSIFSLSNPSNLARFYIWQSAWNIFKDHPITGIGINQFRYFYPHYLVDNSQQQALHHHAHNIYLNKFVELGIVGGLSFLYLLFNIFHLSFIYLKNTKSRNFDYMTVVACLGGLVGVLTHGLFDYTFYDNGAFIFMWIVIGLFNSRMIRSLRSVWND